MPNKSVGRPKTRILYDKICEVCNNPFENYQEDQRTCSRKCGASIRKSVVRIPLKIKCCQYCLEEFEFRYGDKKYCSSVCSKKGVGRDQQKKRMDNYYENPNICKECNIVIPYNEVQGKGGDCKDFCSLSCVSIHSNRQVSEAKQKEYYKKLTICLNCDKIIPYKQRHDAHSFCSLSCASLYTHHHNPKTKEGYEYCYVSFDICTTTKKVYRSNSPNKKGIRIGSPYILTQKEKYINEAKFRFNIYKYPREFNISLLEKYGWYSTNGKINLKGMSRDHMISIIFGFTHNINPKIISHPANCQLMKQTDNIKKQHRCSIEVDELYTKIIKWEEKYGLYISSHY